MSFKLSLLLNMQVLLADYNHWETSPAYYVCVYLNHMLTCEYLSIKDTLCVCASSRRGF